MAVEERKELKGAAAAAAGKLRLWKRQRAWGPRRSWLCLHRATAHPLARPLSPVGSEGRQPERAAWREAAGLPQSEREVASSWEESGRPRCPPKILPSSAFDPLRRMIADLRAAELLRCFAGSASCRGCSRCRRASAQGDTTGSNSSLMRAVHTLRGRAGQEMMWCRRNTTTTPTRKIVKTGLPPVKPVPGVAHL